MSNYTGKIVMIEHSFMLDRHVVAKVLKQTTHTVEVVYWNYGRDEWTDENRRRKTDAIQCVLGDAEPENRTQLDKWSQQLHSYSAELIKRKQDAIASYYNNIRKMADARY